MHCLNTYLTYILVVTQSSTLNTSSLVPEDQVKKREMRLLKNR